MDEPIRAFIGFLRAEQRASPETLRNYASDLRQLHRFLLSRRLVSSPIDPNSLSSDAVRAYLQWLDQKGNKPSSLARKLAAVRSFYRYLSRRGMVNDNPVDGMRTPKQPKLLPRVLTKDDADALMTFPAGLTVWSLRDRALLETLYSTGARVGELVALDIGDVRELEGLVRLQGKGRKERIVPIGEMALDAIRRYRLSLPLPSAGVPPRALFCNQRGGRLSVVPVITRQSSTTIQGRKSLTKGRWPSAFLAKSNYRFMFFTLASILPAAMQLRSMRKGDGRVARLVHTRWPKSLVSIFPVAPKQMKKRRSYLE